MTAGQDVRELLALIDRLEVLLERSALSELELEVGDMTLVLRTPAAVASPTSASFVPPAAPLELVAEETPEESSAHAVLAPLTGVYYRSPSPGAEPYVREGGPVNDGQVIGLIEAMKLFNEIKSDCTGTVRAIVAGDGELVKARQTLIEVDPA